MSSAVHAFASFERKWLAEYPENAMIALFLPSAQRLRASAFGTLIHELTTAAFYASQAQVASTKLAWWHEELTQASVGQPRHPITKVLFADAPMSARSAELWTALAHTALAQIDYHNAASLAELLERFRPWHGAVVRAQAAIFELQPVDCASSTSCLTISHLLHELARLGDVPPAQIDASVLPLDLMARHAIHRTQLSQPNPTRNAFVRDYLTALLHERDQCAEQMGACSLPQRVRSALDRGQMLQAIGATDPLVWLAAHQHPSPIRSLWVSWREARRAYT